MKKFRKNFTLIELMIVMVVISVLAAIAVPQFMKYFDDARHTKMMVNLESVELAKRTAFVAHVTKHGTEPSESIDGTEVWDQITPYLKGAAVDLSSSTNNDAAFSVGKYEFEVMTYDDVARYISPNETIFFRGEPVRKP